MSAQPRDRFFLFLTAGFLLLLLLIYWNRPQTPAAFPAQIQAPQVIPAADTSTTTAAPAPDEFRFEFVMDSMQYGNVKFNNVGYGDSIRLIHIYRTSDGKKIQTLDPGPNLAMGEHEKIMAERFVVEDMNFDGHDDFRIVTWIGMRAQTNYSFWIYDPQTQQFREDTNLAKTADVEFDPVNKTVFSCLRFGCCYEHESKLYTWENGVLVAQREEDVMMDFYDTLDNAVFLTIGQRVNEKMEKRTFRLESITDEYMEFNRSGWCFRNTPIEKFQPPPGSREVE